MKKKNLHWITLIILLLTVNKFFEYKPILDLSVLINIPIFLILLIYTLRNFNFKKGAFVGPLKILILSLFIALFPCVLIWDQELFRSFLAISPYSYFLLYFFLVEAKIDRKVIIKITLAFSYICLILYIYQFIHPETVLFGYREEITEDRGMLRMGFAGEGFLFFALFYYLNKLGKKFNLKYVILIIPFLWMLFIQLTRMYILGFGLILIYHFMLKSKVQYRIAVILFFIASYIVYTNSENVVIKGIRESATSDIEQKKDYIRLVEVDYFINQISKNNTTYFFGNGAIDFKSNYGIEIKSAGDDNNFYLEDIGLVKGYFLFGVLFVVAYLLIYIKSFKLQLPYDLMYLKYFIWMMLVLSFTTRAPADAGFGAVFIIVLYLYDLAYFNHNNSINKISKLHNTELNHYTI